MGEGARRKVRKRTKLSKKDVLLVRVPCFGPVVVTGPPGMRVEVAKPGLKVETRICDN